MAKYERQEDWNSAEPRQRLLQRVRPAVASRGRRRRSRQGDQPRAGRGVAAGAGANIALACDITFAKESASFIQAFSKIGLIPDSGGTFFLPRIIGMQKAAALMMTGDKVTANQAETMNLIYKAVADDSFEDVVNTFVQNIAKMPTKGLGLTKRALNASFSNDLSTQLAVEEELQTEAGTTHDFKEGVQAFLEKRAPNFKGN